MTVRDTIATPSGGTGQAADLVILPDHPAVLDLIIRLDRSLAALAAADDGREVAAAHAVLTTMLAPAARAAEGQWSRRPWTREIAPGTGTQLPWGWWRAGLSPAGLADLHTAASMLATAPASTAENTAAADLQRLLALVRHPEDGVTLEFVDAVLTLAHEHDADRAGR